MAGYLHLKAVRVWIINWLHVFRNFFMRKPSQFTHILSGISEIIFFVLCLLIPAFIIGRPVAIFSHHWESVGLIALTFLLSHFNLRKAYSLPGFRTFASLLTTVWVWWSLLLFIILFLRLPYSRSYVSVGALTVLFFALIDQYRQSKMPLRIAFVPTNSVYDPHQYSKHSWIRITKPQLPQQKIDYLVVDLDRPLNQEWLKFIAECTLQNIMVIDARQFMESYTGQVTLDSLKENELGTLLPPYAYSKIKRGLDILAVIFSLPLVLPLVLISALIIKVTTPGPVLFKQARIGFGGKEFTLYKFRSMYADSEKGGAKFASAKDRRITPIGKWMRKFRIDELPQFWNIFKGEMSLIGPRPEQKVFVDHFSEQISFYSYRHIVRPGLSGWAQVNQGYAASKEETLVKIEYDLFYVKYFSFSLDFLIALRTIKTILTGFGAR